MPDMAHRALGFVSVPQGLSWKLPGSQVREFCLFCAEEIVYEALLTLLSGSSHNINTLLYVL